MSERFSNNPILTPDDIKPSRSDFEVIGAFNAGVAIFKDETILLLRVAERPKVTQPGRVSIPTFDPVSETLKVANLDILDHPEYDFSDPRTVNFKGKTHTAYLTSLSHFRIARSRDGIHFSVDDVPFMVPANEYEAFGIEDPRISEIDGKYYITYSSVSSLGVAVGLAVTENFQQITRLGLIFPPENKDVVIFPELIDGLYYALHRPSSGVLGRPEIWIARSPDLIHWGQHRYLMGCRSGKWDSARLGAGAVPMKTKKGWLEIYHGVDADGRYSLGAVLLDLHHPESILARSEMPILIPETDYEVSGFYGNVVFTCGVTITEDRLRAYYGVADTAMAGVEMSLNWLLSELMS